MTNQTCACPACNCGTSGAHAVERDGQRFCSEACANGHAGGQACPAKGCGCGQTGKPAS